jgi:hypothetical protein
MRKIILLESAFYLLLQQQMSFFNLPPRLVFFVFCVYILISPRHFLAQSTEKQSLPNSLDSSKISCEKAFKQLDLIDIKKKLLKTHHHLLSKDSIKLKPGKLYNSYAPVPGYTIVNGFLIIVASNFSFLTGTIDSTNVSTISFNPNYSLSYQQVMLPLVFNIWTKKNKLNILGDWRYYYYPTYTYGLGGQTSFFNSDLINYSYIRLYQEVCKQIPSTKFYVGVGYDLDYHFDIKKIGSVGAGTNFTAYNGTSTNSISSGPAINILYDSRKNSNNPINNSFYSNLTYRNNLTFLGSTQNWQSIYMDSRAYLKLFRRSDNMLCFWNLNWFTFGGKVPYLDLPSTGWDAYSNTGRGYIQSRFRSQNMIYLESEYRFGISKNGLFGGVVFVNAESVSDLQTNKFTSVYPGYGLGIRLKANKFSGVNFCIDYGFGLQGSKGLAFNVSEVF